MNLFVHGNTVTHGNEDFISFNNVNENKRTVCGYSWAEQLKSSYEKFRNISMPGVSMQQIFRDVLDFLANSPEFDYQERHKWYFIIQLADPRVIEIWEETYGVCIFVQPDNSIICYKDNVRIEELPAEVDALVQKKIAHIEELRQEIYTPTVIYTEFVKNVVLLDKLIKERSGHLSNYVFVSFDKTSMLTGDLYLRGAEHVVKAHSNEAVHKVPFVRYLQDYKHSEDYSEFLVTNNLGTTLTAAGHQIVAQNIFNDIIMYRQWPERAKELEKENN